MAIFAGKRVAQTGDAKVSDVEKTLRFSSEQNLGPECILQISVKQ